MKRTLVKPMLLLFLCLVGFYTQAAELEPIPLEVFAKHPQYSSVKISPDGKYLAFASLHKGKRAIAILQRNPAKVIHVVNFKGNEQAGDFFWANNERIVLKIEFVGGALAAPHFRGEYFAINYDGSNGRNIFGYRSEKGVAISPKIEIPSVLDMLWDEPKWILIQGIPVDKNSSSLTNVYKLNIYSGRKREVAKSPVERAQMVADSNQQIRFAIGVADKNGKNITQVFHRETASDDWQLFSESDSESEEAMIPLGFTLDNAGIFMLSNHVNGRQGIFRFSLADKSLSPIYQPQEVDVNNVYLDHQQRLYAAAAEPAYPHIEVIDKSHPVGKWYPALIKAFHGDRVIITSSTLDNRLLTLAVTSDVNPGTFYVFDSQNGSVELLAKAKPELDTSQLGHTEPVLITSRDGYQNYAYVTTPKNKTKDLPLIILPHGGPHGPRDFWAYDDDVAMLTSRGYAVLKVNFRGSGGYGKQHMAAGYGEWGGIMIDDMTDAALWAIKDGLADPDRLCIYGGSYGGYAALMSVVREPDLYQCAIGYVGIYDMALMFDKGDIPDSKFGQNFLQKVLTSDAEKLDKFSPARHVDKIKANLFIVHGEKDERAHFEHALLLKEKLDEAGKPYRWLTKENEAHGFYLEENRLALYEAMLDFLDNNIGSH